MFNLDNSNWQKAGALRVYRKKSKSKKTSPKKRSSRRPSKKQLAALARGRAIRAKNIKKRRSGKKIQRGGGKEAEERAAACAAELREMKSLLVTKDKLLEEAEAQLVDEEVRVDLAEAVAEAIRWRASEDAKQYRLMSNGVRAMYQRGDLSGARKAWENQAIWHHHEHDGGAEAIWRAAIKADPEYANAHYNLGLHLFSHGDNAGAEASYRRAIAAWNGGAGGKAQNLVSTHYQLGILLQQLGDWVGAESAYRAVIAADPQNANARKANAHYNLGSVLNERGDKVGAEAAFRAVTKNAAVDEHVLTKVNTSLGGLLKERGDLVGAQAAYTAALNAETHKAPILFYNLGNILTLRGDKSGAEAVYRAAIAYRPGDLDAHYNLGYLLGWESGDWAGAEKEFLCILEIDPTHVKANENLPIVRENMRK